ncbi:MAG: prepilin peptidase [Herbiconiux sp.]|uniref:prepilin peptidase n=1 Tax=Herbiconiux sp. TaxID=1871186 RepID=UPI00122B6374|nr:prepilin peptidase [Herbiconiux sp.]TAJ49924.1 MAG: prepilin peptidase [Herbiconiux sp.]
MVGPLNLGDIGPWVVPVGYLALVTVPLAVTDVRTRRLPNALVVPGLMLLGWALVWAALAEPGRALGGLVGAGVAGVLLSTGWMLGAVGMGDVKLGAWLGGTAGMMDVFEHPGPVARGLVAGAVVLAALIVAELVARTPPARARVPFGPPLLAAFWAAAASGLI